MQKKETKSKSPDIVKKLRKYILLIIVLLVMIKINKTVFFIATLSILAYILKYIRGVFGLKMVVLDTLHFSAIMIARYIGIKEAIIFVGINTLIIDFLTFIASDGTFANFFFYSASSVIAVTLLGNTNMLIFGSLAALMYSVAYFLYRTLVIPNPPFEVIAKCITSFIFTFLYFSFFGPILKLLMSA